MGQGDFSMKKDLARVGHVCPIDMIKCRWLETRRSPRRQRFEPGCLGAVCLWADRGTAGIWCWPWLLPTLKVTGWFSRQLAWVSGPSAPAPGELTILLLPGSRPRRFLAL